MAQPHKLEEMKHTRGDGLHFAVPLVGPSGQALQPADMQAIRAAYSTIEAAFKQKGEVKMTLSSTAGELTLVDAYPFPTGAAPALVFTAAHTKVSEVWKADFDVQFGGPNIEPFTWLRGTLNITEDITP